jgi:hypothetical protein
MIALPFAPGDSLAGVLIFRADSATARRLAREDPAIAAGDLAIELRLWLCACGVMPGDGADRFAA